MVIDYWKEHPEMDKNGDGKLQLVYLMGDPGHTASQPRCDYLKSTIEDAGIEIDLLAEDTGMWVTATAKEKMDAVMEEQREKNQKLLEELRKEYEENHEAYAREILEHITEV